jgi:hypothetical protein
MFTEDELLNELREIQNREKDHLKKQKHVTVHGKISFGDLSRIIAEKWKHLPSEDFALFNKVAGLDKARAEKRKRKSGDSCVPMSRQT